MWCTLARICVRAAFSPAGKIKDFYEFKKLKGEGECVEKVGSGKGKKTYATWQALHWPKAKTAETCKETCTGD